MGFFNDLKEDLASAVNQLTDEKSENDIEISSKQMKDEIAKKEKKNKKDIRNSENLEHEIKNYLNISEEPTEAEETAENTEEQPVDVEEAACTVAEVAEESAESFETLEEIVKEEGVMDNSFANNQIPADYQADNNDFSVISKGTVLHGGIDTAGSIEINGVVEGDVKANGELILSGSVTGNVEALIISVNAGKIRGNVKAYNGIYISENSILIGDIESTEAEIGGAVKGKIDVNGPVVLKSEAKVLGDIDCKSVEINNGAVIEGKCSQKYADVSPSAFFENL